MRSPEPGGAPGTPPGPPSPIFLILVCPPETLPSPGFASTFCLSGGGLKRPQPSRGRSARRWGPMLLVLPAPAVKKAAAVRSRWPRPLSAAAVPWQLAAVNAAASFLQCAGPLGRGTRHGPASGNASCCPAAPLPGWKQRGSSPACSTLPALPPEPRTLPCPCLLHVDTSPGLFGVHAHWALLGQDPVSSQSVWMMLLKHNM